MSEINVITEECSRCEDMKYFIKKHIGIVILLVIIFAFPVSMSTQARLNMRVIITGLAIDKSEDGYEVTAQIVKPSPSTESSGTGASINFITDKGETIVSALSKLSYKTGKVAGFSHTNFILIGKNMLDENLNKVMDYFLRDNIIKDSVLILLAEDSAKDEIKKTKDIELSVGLGLQKVFVYKEKEGDGTMTTLLEFANGSYGDSKTAVLSVLSLKDEKSESSGSDSAGQSDKSQNTGTGNEQASAGSETGDSGSGNSQGSESGTGENSQSSSSESSSGGSSGSQSSQYFEAITPLACFVSGKYVGALESEDEIKGYMYSKKESSSEDISLENLNFDGLKNAKVGIDVKDKNTKKRLRFEAETPCLDIDIKLTNASIKEIQSDELVLIPSDEEFEFIKSKLQEKISKSVALSFKKASMLGADIFGAYDVANKFHYRKTKNLFESMEDFLQKLKLNVNVDVQRLEY